MHDDTDPQPGTPAETSGGAGDPPPPRPAPDPDATEGGEVTETEREAHRELRDS